MAMAMAVGVLALVVHQCPFDVFFILCLLAMCSLPSQLTNASCLGVLEQNLGGSQSAGSGVPAFKRAMNMTCFDDEDAVDSGEVSTLVLARSVPAAVEMDHQPEGSGNHLASTMPSAHERCESGHANNTQ